MILLTMVNMPRTQQKSQPLCLPEGSTKVPLAKSTGSAENLVNTLPVNTLPVNTLPINTSPVNTLPMEPEVRGTGSVQNILTTLTPHIGFLATDATDALAFTSASASVGSATLNASDQDNPAVPASTSDEVEEEDDVVVDDDNGNILEQYINAQADLEHELPPVHTTDVSSRLLNKLDKDGKNLFCKELAMVWDSAFDATLSEADATGTRDAHEAAKAYNDQLFRMRAKKALMATIQHTADCDSNMRLVAKTLDGVLTHTNFMSIKALEQAQANLVFATPLAEQKNLITSLAD
jgi:hypothetical protein